MNGELRPGDPPRPADDRASGGRRPVRDARARSRNGLLRRLAGAALALGVLAIGVASLAAWRAFEHFAAGLPTVAGLKDYHPPLLSRVYDDNDHLIAELATERRIYAPYAAIPDRVKNAFVAAEDQNFWTHDGVDPMAILRASVTNLENLHSGRRPIGASTITQQVAKNMLLGNIVTYERKVKEAILALRIEQTLSKPKILEIYLNEIYLGMGAYGIAAAAQTYFDRPLEELTIAQAAFLAALPKGPNNYNPYRYPDAARARRDWVIDRMVDTHAITPAEAREAKAEPLVPVAIRSHRPVAGADWFTDEVKRRLVARFGADEAETGGLTVQTSLDPTLESEATEALRHGLLEYDRAHGTWHGVVTHLAGIEAQRPAIRRHRPRRGEAEPEPAAPAPSWEALLAAVPRPAGMLPDWRLGVVLSETASSARIGWLEDPDRPAPDGTAPDARGRVGTLAWSDASWARGEHGPPNQMRDIAAIGDVVMVEIADAGGAGAHPLLRQVPKVEGAMVCLDPASGRVLALVGGWSFEHSQFNRATQAERQPGSSFKPFVYLAAMEKGIAPSQKFSNGSFWLGNWHPQNYELTSGGEVTLHDALRESLNLVTIRVASHIGMSAVKDTAIAMGEVTDMHKFLPNALGAVDTTVLQEAGAYASLDQDGRLVTPSLIDSVQDRDGHVIWHPAPYTLNPDADPATPPVLADARKQAADPDSDFQVVQMMEDVVRRGTGTPAVVGIDRPVAGKTGTTQNFQDAWFVGFTPGLVTAVWVGFDQPQSLGDKETGGEVAGPIWNAFMKQALDGRAVEQFAVPPGLTLARYDTGRGPSVDAFKDGQVPGQSVGLYGAQVAASDLTLGPQDTGSEVGDIPPPETVSAPGPAGAAPPKAPPPAAGDIGVGGLY